MIRLREHWTQQCSIACAHSSGNSAEEVEEGGGSAGSGWSVIMDPDEPNMREAAERVTECQL